MHIAQHNGNKPQHNEISTTQQKQATTQQNYHNTMETSRNTAKLAQHNKISIINSVMAFSLGRGCFVVLWRSLLCCALLGHHTLPPKKVKTKCWGIS